jgi:hypothetical protein
MIPMQTPIEKKICPQASDQMLGRARASAAVY